MMSDAEFWDTLWAAFHGEEDGVVGAVKNSDMFQLSWNIPYDEQPGPGERSDYWERVFSDSWPAFWGFTLARADAADRLVAYLDTTVNKALSEEAADEKGTTLEDIQTELVQWKDSEAANRFREGYLDHLENALEYEFQYAVALRALIDLQGGLIRAAREGIVDVCKQTVARIKAAEAEAERNARERLGALVSAAFTLAGAAVTGELIPLVTGALTGLGGAVSKAVTANSGATPQEIYEQMFDAVVGLADSVRREQDKVNKGLAILQEWATGKREDMLPPQLTPDEV